MIGRRSLINLTRPLAQSSASRTAGTRFLSATASRSAEAPKKFAPYQWEDPLKVESTLITSEERDIMEVARNYCQERLAPRILEAYRNEDFDVNILKEMGQLGLLGATIKDYGCAGVSSVAYGLVAREVERIDSGYRSGFSVQSSLVMFPIHQYAKQDLKDRLIPKLAKGELIGCFGLTEPDIGSDPAGMKTVAKEGKNGKIIISGAKTWITNAPLADIFIVWAKCQWDGKVRGFVLEKGMKGLSAPKISNKLSLRASVTGSIFMDEVECPEENILQVEGIGKGAFSCLNNARFGICFGAVGALEQSVTLARDYALQRYQFKKPLAAFQLVQKKLADANMEAAIALVSCIQLGRLKDSGNWAPEMISLLKRNNCYKATEHTRTLMEVFGGNAASDEYHIARIATNLHTVSTYEGTYDIHGLILGKSITGVQAFS